MGRERRTVLIFAHECAPYHRPESTIGAQRPAQFAKYLPEFGWRAIVLCCDSRERGLGRTVDVAERTRHVLAAADPDASVIVPLPSLAYDGVLDRAWRALLPRTDRGDRLRAPVRKALTVAKLFTGDYSQPWQPCARRAAEVVAEVERIDACVGEHSPDAGLFLARWFARRYRVPWVADFRDALLQPIHPLARPVYATFARRLLASAAVTVNVTPYWAELDERVLGRRSALIPNGFDPEEFEGPLPVGENTADPRALVVAYAGNIWPQMRMEIFLEGLAVLRRQDPALYRVVRFVYRGHASDAVARSAAAAGVADALDCAPRVPRAQSLALLRRADVLLLLSIADPRREDVYLSRGVYPAKSFEYFGARRPIACVPGDDGVLDELITRTATGVVLRTPSAVAAYLAGCARRCLDGEPVPYAPRADEIARYTRRALSAQFAEVLDRATFGAGAGSAGWGAAPRRTDPAAASGGSAAPASRGDARAAAARGS